MKRSINYPRRSKSSMTSSEDKTNLCETDSYTATVITPPLLNDSVAETRKTFALFTDFYVETGTTSPLINDFMEETGNTRSWKAEFLKEKQHYKKTSLEDNYCSLKETSLLQSRPQTSLEDDDTEYVIEKLVGFE